MGSPDRVVQVQDLHPVDWVQGVGWRLSVGAFGAGHDAQVSPTDMQDDVLLGLVSVQVILLIDVQFL